MQRYYLLTDIATQILPSVEQLHQYQNDFHRGEQRTRRIVSLTKWLVEDKHKKDGYNHEKNRQAQTEADNKALYLKPKVIEE